MQIAINAQKPANQHQKTAFKLQQIATEKLFPSFPSFKLLLRHFLGGRLIKRASV